MENASLEDSSDGMETPSECLVTFPCFTQCHCFCPGLSFAESTMSTVARHRAARDRLLNEFLTSLSVDVFARNQKSFGFLADPLDGDDLATVLAYQKEQGNGSANDGIPSNSTTIQQ